MHFWSSANEIKTSTLVSGALSRHGRRGLARHASPADPSGVWTLDDPWWAEHPGVLRTTQRPYTAPRGQPPSVDATRCAVFVPPQPFMQRRPDGRPEGAMRLAIASTSSWPSYWTAKAEPRHVALVVRPQAANVVPPAAIAAAVAEPRLPRQTTAALPLLDLWHNLGKIFHPLFAPHWAKPSRNSSSGGRPAANPPWAHAGATSGPIPTSNRPRRVPHAALGRSPSGPGRNPPPARSPGRPGTRLYLLQSF
jgi:hypothetical protein